MCPDGHFYEISCRGVYADGSGRPKHVDRDKSIAGWQKLRELLLLKLAKRLAGDGDVDKYAHYVDALNENSDRSLMPSLKLAESCTNLFETAVCRRL